MKNIYTALLAMTGLVFTANGQSTGDYRSAASGNWSDASSWQRFNGSWVAAPSAPGSSDGVISILSGHTITVNSAVTADQIVVNAGGTLIQEADLNLDNGTGNDLTVNGTWTCSGSGSTLGGPGIALVQSPGIVNFAATASMLFGTAITNNGIINWQNGALFFSPTTTFTNNGTMNISGDNPFQNNPGPGTFFNTGTITKTSTGTTLFTIGSFRNSGTINLNGGLFDLGNDFINTGTISFNTGSLNQTAGIFSNNAGSVISGTGSFTNGSGGTLDLNSNLVFPSTVLFSNTGTISGPGNLTINNDFTFQGTIGGSGNFTINANSTWSGGSLDRALIIPATRNLVLNTLNSKLIGAPITNNGTINWQDGSLFFTTTASLTNNGVMNINGDNSMQNNPGPGSFVNTGTVTKVSTGTTLMTLTSFTNSGIINVNGGVLDCGNDFTNTGNLALSSGNWSQTSGTFSHNAGSTITGTGGFANEQAATLDLNSNLVFPPTVIFSNLGTISGAGNLTINNDFTFAGTIGGSGNLTINANSTWNGGSLDRALIIPATRTLTLTTTGTTFGNTGPYLWVEELDQQFLLELVPDAVRPLQTGQGHRVALFGLLTGLSKGSLILHFARDTS